MRSSPLFRIVLSSLICVLATSVSCGEERVSFTRDIRPILSNNCFHCHGPDENTREADLRLDTRLGLLSDGPVVAGDVSASELFRRITSHDTDEVMPPPESNKQLTDTQIALVRRWIEQGAAWEQHWSFRQPQDHPVPAQESDWCRNEIDHFILQRLQSAGLQPTAAAPPDVLLRRVHLDLIGLPPTPGQADQWRQRIWPQGSAAADESEWAALVDELLSSPQYGERWARRWLDLARYADTNGYEKDRDRSIWPWRDWVVEAINSNMPFDRFTIEQLAGDMLPDSTVSQRIATGFHRNTMLNEEGGIDPLEFRYHAMTDRVATTGTTWLGLTLGCCQCHTHKYDPVSHTEYFQVFALLNNADEPYIELPADELDRTYERNQKQARRLLQKLATQNTRTSFAAIDAPISRVTASGRQTIVADGQVVSVQGDNPATATYTVTLQPQQSFQMLQLIATTPHGTSGPGRTPHGNFVLSEIELELVRPDGSSTPVRILSATADAEQPGHSIESAFDGRISSGWAIHKASGVAQTATATFTLEPTTVDIADCQLEVTLRQLTGGRHTLGQFQISPGTADSPAVISPSARDAELAAWLQEERSNAVPWHVLRPVAATSNLPLLTIEEDHSIFASGDTAKRDDYEITLAPSDYPVTAVRLEALPDERLPARGPGTTYYEGTIGDFYLTEIQFASGDKAYPVQSASHSYAKNRFGKNPATAALAIDGDIQTGWSVHGRQGERHVAVFLLKEAVPPGRPLTVRMSFGRHFASSLGKFRFSAADTVTKPQARDWSPQVARILSRPQSQWSTEERRQATEAFLLSQPEFREQAARIRKLQQRPAAVTSLVLQERPTSHPRPTFRHHRGEYLQPQERVLAGLPSVLHNGTVAPSNRLEFARWIVSADNPLTARVVVNRQWAAFFGTGIVKTLDDFGLQGEAPSHPELLDWLAVRFRGEDAWSVRALHKRIVTSATYRQSSVVPPAAGAVDPGNRLLSYGPRFALEAEIIRDQLLLAAGVLSSKIGGPPVRPPQPVGVTEAAYGRPKWNASAGKDRYRRSLYTFAKRTAPFAMFATFDAPSGEACIARRNRSNSPLQALTLLNDVMLMDIAQQSGRRLAALTNSDGSQAGADQRRINDVFRRTLVRSPTTSEQQLLHAFLERRRSDFQAAPETARAFAGLTAEDGPAKTTDTPDAVEIAAWTALSRTLFGLDETLTRE